MGDAVQIPRRPTVPGGCRLAQCRTCFTLHLSLCLGRAEHGGDAHAEGRAGGRPPTPLCPPLRWTWTWTWTWTAASHRLASVSRWWRRVGTGEPGPREGKESVDHGRRISSAGETPVRPPGVRGLSQNRGTRTLRRKCSQRVNLAGFKELSVIFGLCLNLTFFLNEQNWSSSST